MIDGLMDVKRFLDKFEEQLKDKVIAFDVIYMYVEAELDEQIMLMNEYYSEGKIHRREK